MEKIGLLTKKYIIEELAGKITNANGFIFISFNKIGAFPLNVLRNNLRQVESSIFATKNSLFKRAFSSSGREDLNEFLDLETGIIFVSGENVVEAAKIIVDFAKENECLNLKGAVVGLQRLTSKEVAGLANLPSKDVLLGMALSAIVSPLTGFLSSLNQVILKFVWTIEEIKKNK